MSFDQALRLTSILLASASFIGLALGAGLPEWQVLLTGSALILVLMRALGAAALDRVAALATLSTTTWNIILIVGFLGFWVDMLWVSGELLRAGVHFLLVLMVIKLFNLHLRRDYLHLYAISLMAILASAAMTTDLWYLPIFLAYLLTGVWTLLLFQMTKKADEPTAPAVAASAAQRHAQSRVTPELFWLANGLAFGALCLTLIIFFAIPRVSAGLFQQGYGESIRTSGFSDTVDLGAIGPVKQDPSVVMRVELPGGSAGETGGLYLRGVAYDRYDGTTWANQLSHRRALPESETRTFVVRQRSSRPSPKLSPPIRQNILLEPLDTPVLFGAPFAETVSGRFLTVQADPLGSLSLPFPSSSRMEYSVVSRTALVVPADLQLETASYPDSFARHFLQLPDGPERIAQLAADVTRQAHTQYDKARAVQEYLLRTYRYSLDVPFTAQTRPIEEFLFTRKTGYCEHYATAMVIMLRTVGVPARLVTGFLATEWNEYGNYYLVRQQDAHAWVEVHLPHSGWITMDPTPAVAVPVETTGWRTLVRIMDHLRLRWNRFFVQYSAADQLAVVRELKAGGESVRNRAWQSVTSFLSPVATRIGSLLRSAMTGNLRLVGIFVGLMLCGLGAILWLIWRAPWQGGVPTGRASRADQPITRLYLTMLRHLASHGFTKPPTTAPLEFLCLVQKEWASASELVATLTELYCRGRFGQNPLTDEDLLLARHALRELLVLERR